MNIYALPIFGWFLGLLFHASMAIPFWIVWNWLAPKFAYWLPAVYQHLGFWETVGLFIIMSTIKAVVLPTSFSSSSSGKD